MEKLLQLILKRYLSNSIWRTEIKKSVMFSYLVLSYHNLVLFRPENLELVTI